MEANTNIRYNMIKKHPNNQMIGNDNTREHGGKKFPNEWIRG
jgi:hypothetical protein